MAPDTGTGLGLILDRSLAWVRARRWYLLIAAIWFLAALAVKPFYPYVDFAAFYSTAIEKVLSGAPLDMYSFVARPQASDLAIPLMQPPIFFLCQAPWYAIGRLLGFDDFHRASGISWGQAWMLVSSLPLDVWLCREVIRLGERIRGPWREPDRLILFAFLLGSPLLWLSSVRYGHDEAAMLLLVILGLSFGERARGVASGVCFGLALGVKTTAIVPVLTYLAWGMRGGRRRDAGVTAITTGLVFAAPLLPFLVARTEQIVYALVRYETLLPVGGYVLWKLPPFSGFETMIGLSNLLIVIVGLLLGFLPWRRPPGSFLESGGVYLLILGQIAILLLGKALYVWYGLGLFVFVFLAHALRRDEDSDRPARLPLAPIGVGILLWYLQSGAWPAQSVDTRVKVWSAVWVVFLTGVAASTIREMVRKPDASVAG